MVIETPRLILREMEDGDFAALRRVLGDRHNMRFYPYVFDDARIRAWITSNIERYSTFGFGLWAVCMKDGGELIGDCGLTMQNINGVILPEIGYHMRGDMQRNGYAREAASAVRDWAFRVTPFRRLFSYMPAAHVASAATARSIGMELANRYIDSSSGIETLVYEVCKSDKAEHVA
ncbi:MAG: GNAT family N-acetyltransferase [Actinomycetaceae bacterium]|nr:GNAT family N-acetyltransferase [Arcanobacterium sp.]MDD7504375.1 GNAT family N-acetyltransferase [Actinomycetaceae bacterium]MDY6143039.1 GNAT family N-acetyltransferase [Arcanobacterium sp.]